MAEDVVFCVAGREPFGKQEFIAGFGWTEKFRLHASNEIVELQVLGDWAYLRCRLKIAMTPVTGGDAIRRYGYTLTILRKRQDGHWELFRDANMLTPEN